MKKRLVQIAVLFALVISTISGISVAAAPAAAVEFFDAYGDAITVLTEENEISARITFINPPSYSCNANVIAALYEEGKMSGFKVVAEQSIIADEPTIIPVEEFSIGNADEVELFVWNGFDSLSPLVANSFSIKRTGYNPSAPVETENGKTTKAVTLTAAGVTAQVPAGVIMEDGVKTIGLIVTPLLGSSSGITAGENEQLDSLDVHIEGVSKDNKTPIIITIEDATAIGLNAGNLALYHVENGETVQMTQVSSVEELTAHNSFFYDAVTGSVTLALCTFSEIALLSDTENAWNGTFDYSWYDAAEKELVIANADQLAALGAIVGGMAEEIEKDSFLGKTVKLVADINIGDVDEETMEDDIIFYPIGYYSSDGLYEKTGVGITSGFYPFEGTFDGNGHTISNIYQNTWGMKGDHNWYTPEEQYFRDGMGVFGKLYGATVKNLTVDNFSSDGEITTTGVIAAYAESKDGRSMVFENIAITNCNPRVYNIGNGGIVGSGGWYSREDTTVEGKPIIFKNITVDNTNKISALWGSWDVACAGIMGRYYPDSNCGVVFENCHVGAQIDVFNDVCGNYQYYWYRYAGMMIGTVEKSTTDEKGYTVPDMTGVTAKNCTVHFGDWNDYYYCELVANSLASYTHDHQFSRLDIINNVSEIQDESGNWNKAGNFGIIADAENNIMNECFHIVKDADGNLVEHKHEDSGYEASIDEDGNGEVDLKEDKQRVYLPFNQLFQGDGWGVKHIPVYNGEDYAFEGITILDKTVADSEVKFTAKVDATEAEPYVVLAGSTVALEDLFSAVEGQNINTQSVHVSVTKVDAESSASANYTINRNNWALGSVKFSGAGTLKLTIQDYNYCVPTELYVNVVTSITEIEDTFINTYKDVMDLSSYEAGTILNNSNVADTKLITFAGVGSSERVSEITGTAGKTMNYANPIDITEKVTASGNEKVSVEEVDGEKVIKLEVKKGNRNAGIGLAPISGASLVNASANEVKYFQFDLYQPDEAHKLGALNIGFAKIGADGKLTYYDVNELKASDPAKFSAKNYPPIPGGEYGVAPVFYYEHSIPKLHTINRHNASTGAYLAGGAFGDGAPSFLHLNGVGVAETAKIYDHWYSNSFGFQYVSGVGIRIKSRSSYDVNNESWSYNNCLIPLTAEELADIKNVKIVPVIAINGYYNDTYTYIKDLRGYVETGYTKSTVEETEIIALDNFESNAIGLANQTVFNSSYIKGFGVYSNRYASSTSSNTIHSVSVEAVPDGYAGNSSAKALRITSAAANASAWPGFRSQPIPTSIFTSNVNGAVISYDTLRTGSNAGNGRIYFYSSDVNGNRAAADENNDKSDAFKIMSHMVNSDSQVNFTFNNSNGNGANTSRASYTANKNWIRVEFKLRAADNGTAIVNTRSCNLATGVWTDWTSDISFPLDLYSASHLVWAETYNNGSAISHYYDNFMIIAQKASAVPVVKGSTEYSVLADDTITATLDSVVSDAGLLSQVQLKDSEGNVVPANVTGIVMGTKSVVSIEPEESLTAGNTYTVDFKGNKLLNGNTVINPVFTVAEAPATEAPVVVYNGTDYLMKGETFTVAMKVGEQALATDDYVVYADSDAVTITEADGVYNITANKDGQANIYVQSLLHSGAVAEKFAISVVVPEGLTTVTFKAGNYLDVVEVDSNPVTVIKGGKLGAIPAMTDNEGISPVKYIIGETEYTREQLLGLTINEPLEIKVIFKMNRIYNYDFDLTTMTEEEYALTPFADETRWTFVPGVGIKLSDNGTSKSPEVKFWSDEEDTAYVFEYDYIQGKGDGEKTHGGFDADFYAKDSSRIERFFHTTGTIHTFDNGNIRGFENINAGADNETVHTMTHVMDRANNKSVVMLDGVVGINQYDTQDLTSAKAPYRFVMATNIYADGSPKAVGKFIITRLSFKSYESINIPTVSISAGENISSAKMGSVTSRKIPEGGKIAVTATAANHYELDRWDITGEGSVENGFFTAGSVDTQIKAVAKPKSYTVTFDAGENGTIAEGNVQSVVYNTYPAVPQVTANDGYTFLSWDKTVTEATGDVTYTAQYTTEPTYAVTFNVLNPNTAVVDETINVVQGATLTVLPLRQVKMSAQFLYWEGEDGTQYSDDELMAKVFEADETFTAVYKQTKLNAGIYDFDKYGYDNHSMTYDDMSTYQRLEDEEGVKFIRVGTHYGLDANGNRYVSKNLSLPFQRVTEGTWAFTIDFKYKGGGFDSNVRTGLGNTGDRVQGMFVTAGGYTYSCSTTSPYNPERDPSLGAFTNIADGERHTITWFFDLDNNNYRMMVDGVLYNTYTDKLISTEAIGSMFLAFKGYAEEGDSEFDIYRIGMEQVDGELVEVTGKVNGAAKSYYIYKGKAYAGDKVLMNVVPESGWHLNSWTANGEEVSTEGLNTFTVTEDTEFVADIKQTMITLTYRTTDHVRFEGVDGDVYVTPEFPQNSVPSAVLGDKAVPKLILDEGWEFYKWNLVGAENRWDYRIPADTGCRESLDMVAVLKYVEYDVTFNQGENGTIEGAVDGNYTVTVPSRGMPEAPKVVANDGYKFIGWDKEIEPATSEVTYTAKYAKLYTVKFEPGENGTFADDDNLQYTEVVYEGTYAIAGKPTVVPNEGYEWTGVWLVLNRDTRTSDSYLMSNKAWTIDLVLEPEYKLIEE